MWGHPRAPHLQIDDSVASLVIAQLLFLQSESNKKPIHMYINSPGEQGLPALRDSEQRPPIRDVLSGEKKAVEMPSESQKHLETSKSCLFFAF